MRTNLLAVCELFKTRIIQSSCGPFDGIVYDTVRHISTSFLISNSTSLYLVMGFCYVLHLPGLAIPFNVES